MLDLTQHIQFAIKVGNASQWHNANHIQKAINCRKPVNIFLTISLHLPV